MDISALTGGSSSGSSKSGSAASSLMTNYDTFLRLLTTQLTTQNPLDPMDSEKFTEQLVSFSSVEQQIATNSNLESMLSAMAASATLNLVNYVGQDVTALSDTTRLENGSASWDYTLGADAETVKVTITNSAGAVVRTETIAAKAGEQTYEWDGTADSGTAAPSGNYTISFKAADGEGKSVSVSTRITGTVSTVDFSGTEPYLTVAGRKIPLSNVLSVSH